MFFQKIIVKIILKKPLKILLLNAIFLTYSLFMRFQMPKIVKINSENGLVSFTNIDLVEHDLLRWVRSSSKGLQNRSTISDVPFEHTAAKVFVERYPEDLIKLANKIIVSPEGDAVDVYLKLARPVSEDMYEKHPTKVVISK